MIRIGKAIWLIWVKWLFTVEQGLQKMLMKLQKNSVNTDQFAPVGMSDLGLH